jgi:predicted permease
MRQATAIVRQFIRQLWRSPGYSIVSILVLGIGTGVGLAALAIAQRALLEPLAYERTDRLVILFEADQGEGRRLASYPTVQDWSEAANVFVGMAYVTGAQELLRQPSGPELMTTAYADEPFFATMRATPLLGRAFGAGVAAEGRVVVLSEAAWRQRFGARRDIVGTQIPLGDGAATVIGVMPRAFRFPEWAEAWMPLGVVPPGMQRMLNQRGNHADSRVVARLRDGVTPAQANARMNAIAARLAQAYPAESKEFTRAALLPMSEYITSFTNAGSGESLVPRIGLVAGAAALLLLLGSANVAVLTLVRGMTRARELAVRAAIGASRARIVRLLVSESIALAAAGALVGLALAYAIVRAAQQANPDLFPRLTEIQFDSTFILGAVFLTIVVGIAAGLLPAIYATPKSLITVMGTARAQPGGARATRRAQRLLIGGQVAVTAMLLVGAGLLVLSLKRVIDTPVGFNTERLTVIAVNPPGEKYDSRERTLVFYRRLMDAVQQVPGVQSVAFANHAPLGRAAYPTRVLPEGQTTEPENQILANFKSVTPNYFTTAGIQLVGGRTYTESTPDAPNGELVINTRLAQRLWPNEPAIGKRLTVYHSARWLPTFGEPIVGTVIGVIGNVRHFGQETEAPEEVYVPYTWDLWQWGSLVVRSSREPREVQEAIRRAMLAVEPDLPIGGAQSPQSFGERLTALRAPRRLLTAGLSFLAVAALGITMLGLYATLAYAVARRRSELGVRLALGATRTQLLRLVLREGLGVVLVGAVIGLAGAWLGARLLDTLLYGISPRNVIAYAVPLVPVIAAATAAIWLPARRAARLNPTDALRSE